MPTAIRLLACACVALLCACAGNDDAPDAHADAAATDTAADTTAATDTQVSTDTQASTDMAVSTDAGPPPQCLTDADCSHFDDADLCNGTIHCDKGKCAFAKGSTVLCDATNDTVCAQNTCNPATGKCVMKPAPAGTPCVDSDPCTVSSACAAGSCTAGKTSFCQCQTTADCQPLQDGDLCNGTLVCDKSFFPWACRLNKATVIACDGGADTACAVNACKPATGMCAPAPAPDGTPCEDGEKCTAADACKAGVCAAGVSVCQCQKDADCDPLQDGNLCNGTLVCNPKANACVVDLATKVTCTTAADTACLRNTCVPATGACKPTATADATACQDGDPYTVGDHCKAGTCAAGQDVCACKMDKDCAALEDGNACNGTLYCTKKRTCAVDLATVVTCTTTGDTACTKNTCQAKTG